MQGTEAKHARKFTCRRCSESSFAEGRRGCLPSLCEKCKSKIGDRATVCVVCKQCGYSTFKSRPQQFCSKACDKQWRDDHAHKQPCKQCGELFRCSQSDVANGRSYCSTLCRRRAWRQGITIECEVCKKQFIRRRGSKDKNLCCSRECGWKLKSIRTGFRKAIRGVGRLVRKLQKSYRKAKRAVAEQLKAEAKKSELRKCLRCGKPFRKGNDKLCSAECRRDSRRINKRAGKKSQKGRDHVSRCKEKGLPYELSLRKHWIEDRDGCRCMLCGVATVTSDSKLAPTIGHIVPLNNPLNKTHGHTASNTYVNCAVCNGKQGNAVMIDGHQNHADPRASYLEHLAIWGYPFQQNCHPVQIGRAHV